MIKQNKICLVTPSLALGGMERVLSLLANYANKKGNLVFIICLIENKIEYPLDENIKVYSPDFKYKKGLINKLDTLFFLYKTLRYIRPRSVLCFSEVFNPLAIIAAKLARLPVYISDRSNPYKVFNKSVRLFRKLTYPFANGMIAQTELSKKVATEMNYNKNIIVIPNPLRSIDDTISKRYRKQVISMGRLIPTKNFEELIEIFASIPKPEWELIIIGDGEVKERLNQKKSELGVENRVHLIGAVKDVDAYFAEASIFAFTSLSEGFPNALSEAMAFPLASIAYDCPAGPKDIIRNNYNGILIPMGEKELFRTKLSMLMDNFEMRVSLQKKALLNRSLFSIELISEKYLNFILS